MDFIKLTYVSEKSLGDKKIEDWFDKTFFDSKFWYIWSTMFAFQKWCSLVIMRRYMKRFMHLVDGLPKLGGVMRTKYNQYDSVIRPMKRYLEERSVQFELGKEVVDIDFNLSYDKKTATILHLQNKTEIILKENDFVFFTNGSITESSDNGTWDNPAKLKGLDESGSWKLWKKIAKKDDSYSTTTTLSKSTKRCEDFFGLWTLS